ncbi:MAG TPA: FAD:protein FMN transferase [Thermoanaerobaculia bacterium]
MFPHLAAILALTLLSPAALPAQPLDTAPTEPIRMAVAAFGTTAEVEVRDLPAAEARQAVEAALTEIFNLSQLADPQGTLPEGIGALNGAAGKGPRTVDARLAELLLRSLQFCIWSGGAYGPLGGDLLRLWSERPDADRPPSVGDLRVAVGAAECSRLQLHGKPAAAATRQDEQRQEVTANLLAGSRVDLTGIARGFAVDRAVDLLAARGAGNVWVGIGNVWRGRGGGPEGRGWLAELPPAPGSDEPIDRLWLRDQAVAIAGLDAGDGEAAELILDQRSGVPARGVVCVVAVSELAVDAEPLVRSLLVLGHREGHMRLGSLQPRPSVYWLLGEGLGAPLEATYRWSELERLRRR